MKRWKGARELVTIVVFAVALTTVVQTFVAQPIAVEQESMLPGLRQGDMLLVNRLAPAFGPYASGDIVVLRNPDASSDPLLIKRVVAVGGQRVQLRDGAVIVDGSRVTETYTGGSATEAICGEFEWEVATEQVFVMGDNRPSSRDSRCFGPVALRAVVGKAVLRYWPLERAGFVG